MAVIAVILLILFWRISSGDVQRARAEPFQIPIILEILLLPSRKLENLPPLAGPGNCPVVVLHNPHRNELAAVVVVVVVAIVVRALL